MKTKIPTVTPKGALKKMNFQADADRTGRESRTEVLRNMRSSRWSGPDRRFTAISNIVIRNGVPGRMRDGVWTAMAKKA